MKWFISCLVILFFTLSLMIGLLAGLIVITVDEKIEQANRASLLAYYNIKEE